MFSKHSQRESKIAEVEIQEALPATSSQEPFQAEPRLDYSHYEPVLDPESEFPWHHPDAQIPDVEVNVPEIDVTQFHDPWDIYRGHIPPSNEDSSPHQSELQKPENHDELRKYAWDYLSPPHCQSDVSPSNVQNIWQTENTQPNQSEHIDHSHDFRGNLWEYNPHYDYSQDQYSQNLHQQTPNYDHHQHDHIINKNITDTFIQPEEPFKHLTQQHHHQHSEHSQQDNETFTNNHDTNQEFQKHSTFSHAPKDQVYLFQKDSENVHYPTYIQQHKVEHTYYIHQDHEKVHGELNKNENSETETESKLNGCCETEYEVFENIRPRHPYDGFYLRHRMTIDSRGKKICTHEIPPTPTPTPPESPIPMENSLQLSEEEEQLKRSSDTEDQTGVAGNLARVVLGAGAQREALDDLTRRQGWEAGNIDYMGADAFDNIWAKISQTLSQPRSSPPKQSTPPPQPAEPAPPAPVEEVQQVVEISATNVPEEVQVASSAPVSEVAADPPFEVPVKAPAAKVVTPVETAKLPESPIPTEAPAEIAASTPIQLPEPPVKALIPAAALVAAPVPAKVVAAAIPTEEPKPADPAESPVVKTPVAAPPVVPEKSSATIPSQSSEATKKAGDAASAVPPKVVSTPAKAPVAAPSKPELTPVKGASTDSPPLANTPSKEEVPIVSAAKSEERRKPAGKLQLQPPAAADPLPTPDSELEDAATLAHAIIASELRSPTVTSPSPPADPASPRPPLQEQRLSVEEPEIPTPPVGGVSLSQIGVKPQPKGKSTTAAQIESSITEAAADAPRKKVVKKVLKKEGAAGGEAPVPPPRKKEKKPKDK